jgi:hypothetical protein
VTKLVGLECERTLATNSIKLRFVAEDKRLQGAYIWIDPPWELFHDLQLVTTSEEYVASDFNRWSEMLHPLDRTVLKAWNPSLNDATVFTFESAYRLLVPHLKGEIKEDRWYLHWYAQDFRA